jgi:hypothetical protein
MLSAARAALITRFIAFALEFMPRIFCLCTNTPADDKRTRESRALCYLAHRSLHKWILVRKQVCVALFAAGQKRPTTTRFIVSQSIRLGGIYHARIRILLIQCSHL